MSSTTKTTTENKPPEWAAEGYKQAGSEAQRLYNSGSGGNTYLGSTVAPLSDTTMSGVNQMAQAGANWNTAGSRPLFQGIGAGAGSVYDAAGAPSSAATNLSGYASGEFLDPATNPYFEPALQGQLDKTASQIQSQFSGAGRYGSGANTSVLANELGGLRTNAFMDQFNRNTANQFGANQQIDAARNASQGMQLGALGVGQTAANSIAGLDQQNFQNRLTGANATLQAGNIVDTQGQKDLMDEINKFYALDNADWDRLGMYEQALAGAAGNYGTQNSTARTSGIAPFASALGGGLGSIKKAGG